jgi:hypothetical protein
VVTYESVSESIDHGERITDRDSENWNHGFDYGDDLLCHDVSQPSNSASPVLICTCKWYGIMVTSQITVWQMNESSSLVSFVLFLLSYCTSNNKE